MGVTDVETEETMAARDKNEHLLTAAITIANGIGAMFGDDCEVAVHDLRNPTRSLVHLVNGHISGRQLGHPIRDLIYAVLPHLPEQNVLANYPTPLEDGRVLKSTTCLIRDEAGEPLIALCINFDVSNFKAMAAAIERFTGMTEVGAEEQSPEPDLGQAKVLDVLRVLVRNTARQFGRSPKKLTKEERLQAIEFLDSKGAFLIKGSVPMVASTLGISEPSVYRYLDMVRAGRDRSLTG